MNPEGGWVVSRVGPESEKTAGRSLELALAEVLVLDAHDGRVVQAVLPLGPDGDAELLDAADALRGEGGKAQVERRQPADVGAGGEGGGAAVGDAAVAEVEDFQALEDAGAGDLLAALVAHAGDAEAEVRQPGQARAVEQGLDH